MKVQEKGSKYCAFLRGVNVRGTNMKMATVCTVFAEAGVHDVSSVLASGNILFSSEQSAKTLTGMLAEAMGNHFAYDAFLFVKERMEIEAIVRGNPFDVRADEHVYCFLGAQGIELVLFDEYKRAQLAAGEEAKIVDGHFYWKVPKGSSIDSGLGKVLGNKRLKDSFTSRNINTMVKVLNKM